MISKLSKILFLVFVIGILSTVPVSAGWWDWLFKSSTKQVAKQTVKTEKQIASATKTESKIEQNALKGAEWEKKAEQIICSQKKCVYSINDAMNGLKNYQTYTYTIVGGKTTKEFINKNNLFKESYFTKEPDFLEITQTNGKISKIKIIDAKTSADAARPAQESAFKELCIKATVPCEVDYAVPKTEASNTGLLKGACMFAYGNIVPDPIDALCLLITYAD